MIVSKNVSFEQLKFLSHILLLAKYLILKKRFKQIEIN